jgi:uncharacterized protein (DUF362 family)
VLVLEPFDTPAETLSRLLERLLPELAPGTRVFVKPNWCARTPPKASENTTPEFLDGLLAWLEQRGVEITVGHASLLTPPDHPYMGFANLIRMARTEDLLEKYPHVRFLDLELEPMEVRTSGDVSLLLPQVLRDQDLHINCARLKTHMMTQVSVGGKNLMGLLPDNEKLRLHRDGLEPLIAHLGNMVWPELTLVEADLGMEGEGSHHGDDIECGYYLGGDDVLEVDAVCTRLMGLDPEVVEHLRGLAELRGTTLAPLPPELEPWVRAFRPPAAYLYYSRRTRVWPGDSCSTCHMAAKTVVGHVKENPHKLGDLVALANMMYLKGFNLYLGHHPESGPPPEGEISIAIGDCAQEYAEQHDLPFIGGCPVRYHGIRPALVELVRRMSKGDVPAPEGR